MFSCNLGRQNITIMDNLAPLESVIEKLRALESLSDATNPLKFLLSLPLGLHVFLLPDLPSEQGRHPVSMRGGFVAWRRFLGRIWGQILEKD